MNMPRAFKVTWLFLLVAPTALAADEAVGPGPAPAGPMPGAVGAAAPADQRLTMSGAEMLRQGQEYRQQIQAIVFQIQSQSEQAKHDKDVIRLNCLLDKATQVRVNAGMLDQALQALQEAISRRDEGAQLHEYTRVTIINQKAQVLRTEADACVGAETNYVGSTKVLVEVPQGISDNPDEPPPAEPPVTVVERPPVASPYQ
jgi:hypothetical protein